MKPLKEPSLPASLCPPLRRKRLQRLILRDHILARRLVPNRNIDSEVLHAARQTNSIQREQRRRDRRATFRSARGNGDVGSDVADDIRVLCFRRPSAVAVL